MAECGASLAAIEKTCGGNSPGLKTYLYIAHKSEVTAIPDPDTGTLTVSGDMTMRAADAGPPEVLAGTFKRWEISKGGSSYESNPEGEDENVNNVVTVKAFMNKLEDAKSYILDQAHGGEYIVLAPDRNGQLRIIGDLEEGCTIRTKEQTNDKNGYDLTIEWESVHLPYYYTGTITT
jgi:hypothetical protein